MTTIVPSLIIGGASKSGTTALYYYLKQHPGACVSEKKELHFFSRPFLEAMTAGPGDKYILSEIPNSFEQYLSYYASANNRIAIDISPSYLFHYQSAMVLHELAPEAKVVFILRNPVDKAFSQYVHLLGAGRETLSFDAALAAEPGRKAKGYSDMWLYRESGLYADALEYFFSVVGRSNVKVFYYEELLASPDVVLKEICGMVGLDTTFQFSPVHDVNRSGQPRSALVANLLAPNPFTFLLRRIIPMRIGRVVRKWLKDRNTGDKPSLSASSRDELTRYYASDIARVESLVGRASGWRPAS